MNCREWMSLMKSSIHLHEDLGKGSESGRKFQGQWCKCRLKEASYMFFVS